MKKILTILLAASLFLLLAANVFAADTAFNDVAADADYAAAVEWCSANGLMNGVAEGTFAPDDTLTRAMLATALYRAAGSPAVTGAPAFTDTQAGAWYANAVVWANDKGLVKGYGDGLFGTDDPITREQLAAILWRYDGEKVLDYARISDRNSVSEYAKSAVDWAVGAGVMTYRADASFAPQANAVRSEIASALYAYLAKKDNATPGEDQKQTGKALVVYYSATGSTKAVAQTIADTLKADTFELVPAEPYTSADLSWTTSGSRVNREHDNESLRDVKLTANKPANWGDYDTVFVGYPIWWGIAAWPVNDFVKNNDFAGKTVIPFCTSASSGLGQSGSLLAGMATGGDWQTGKRFSSGAAAGDVTSWLQELKLVD